MKSFLKTAVETMFLPIAILVLTFTPGCAVPPPSVLAPIATGVSAGAGYAIKHFIFDELPIDVLKGAGREAALLGIRALPAADRVTAASALILVCKISRSYVDSTPISAQEFNIWLTNEFGTLSPELLQFIASAAAQLDYYIPLADTLTLMTQQMIGYADAFIDGLSSGAEDIIANPQLTAKVKYTREDRVRKTLEKRGNPPRRWLQLIVEGVPNGQVIEVK